MSDIPKGSWCNPLEKCTHMHYPMLPKMKAECTKHKDKHGKNQVLYYLDRLKSRKDERLHKCKQCLNEESI